MCSSLLFTAYRTIASNVSILRARAIYSDIGQRMTLSRSSRPICRCGYEDKLPLPGVVFHITCIRRCNYHKDHNEYKQADTRQTQKRIEQNYQKIVDNPDRPPFL